MGEVVNKSASIGFDEFSLSYSDKDYMVSDGDFFGKYFGYGNNYYDLESTDIVLDIGNSFYFGLGYTFSFGLNLSTLDKKLSDIWSL